MKKRFFFILMAVVTLADVSADEVRPGTFRGRVYQVDTIFNNLDVYLPGGKKTLWADARTRVRVHQKSAQLIDIAMGDEVRGTYILGDRGEMVILTIEDLAGG